MRYCTENTVVAKSNTWGQALAPALIWAGEVILLRLCVLYVIKLDEVSLSGCSSHCMRIVFLFFVIVVGGFLRLNKIYNISERLWYVIYTFRIMCIGLVINFAFTYQVAVFIPICLIRLYCLPLWVCPIQLFLRSNKTY